MALRLKSVGIFNPFMDAETLSSPVDPFLSSSKGRMDSGYRSWVGVH